MGQKLLVGMCAAVALVTAGGATAATAAVPQCSGADATIVGTPGDDTLYGTPGDDVIVGGGGDDDIDAGAGNDAICPDGGDGEEVVGGNDAVLAGPGGDAVFASGGNDDIDGGDGRDYLAGGDGDDWIVTGTEDDADADGGYADGGEGDDRLRTGAVGDQGFITGGPGDDELEGGTGYEYLEGGDGDDRLSSGGGIPARNDYLDGGPGDDRLRGSSSEEFLDGGDGNDSLDGRGGWDFYQAGAGNDGLDADDGETNRFFDCGDGIDTLVTDRAADAAVVDDGCERDSDGDGLLDLWEEEGYDWNGDGVIDVDLPALGANPDRKDVFVRAVWFQDRRHSHRPTDATISQITMAFAEAPLLNPDLSTGIALHVQRAGSVPETSANRVLDDCKGDNWSWSWLDEIKDHGNGGQPFLTSAEARVFHFAAFGHDARSRCEHDPDDHTDFIGISRNRASDSYLADLAVGEGSSDLLSAMGDETDTLALATNFMHELGHNLGLGHGGVTLNGNGVSIGADHYNRKPNHLSVMNYRFSDYGLLRRDPGSSMIGRVLDYSRFGNDDIPGLSEQWLKESDGLRGSPAVDDYVTRFACPDGDVLPIYDLSAPVSWDCDDDYDEILENVNITGDGDPPIAEDTLQTANEWEALVYTGGIIGHNGPAPELPAATDPSRHPEPTPEDLDKQLIRTSLTATATPLWPLRVRLEARLTSADGTQPVTGARVSFRIRNGRRLCDGTTDAGGRARCVDLTLAPFFVSHVVEASFAGNRVFAASAVRARR